MISNCTGSSMSTEGLDQTQALLWYSSGPSLMDLTAPSWESYFTTSGTSVVQSRNIIVLSVLFCLLHAKRNSSAFFYKENGCSNGHEESRNASRPKSPEADRISSTPAIYFFVDDASYSDQIM